MGRYSSSDDIITIMSLDPKTTNEADLRRTLANTIKGGYDIKVSMESYRADKDKIRVAVVEQRDIDTVLSSFDVINRETNKWFGLKPVWDF